MHFETPFSLVVINNAFRRHHLAYFIALFDLVQMYKRLSHFFFPRFLYLFVATILFSTLRHRKTVSRSLFNKHCHPNHNKELKFCAHLVKNIQQQPCAVVTTNPPSLATAQAPLPPFTPHRDQAQQQDNCDSSSRTPPLRQPTSPRSALTAAT